MVDPVTGAVVVLALAAGTQVLRGHGLARLDARWLATVGRVSGVAAPTIALGGIAIAIALSPSFSVVQHTLSDLGAGQGPAATVFNYAMIGTGLAALPFGVALLVDGNRYERLAVVFLAVSMNGLNMVGLFQKGQRLHVVGGVLYFVSFTVAFVVYGLGTGDPRRGRVTLWLAAVHVGVWTLWGVALLATGLEGPVVYAPGSLAPQVVGAVVLSGWTVWTALERLGSLSASAANAGESGL